MISRPAPPDRPPALFSVAHYRRPHVRAGTRRDRQKIQLPGVVLADGGKNGLDAAMRSDFMAGPTLFLRDPAG